MFQSNNYGLFAFFCASLTVLGCGEPRPEGLPALTPVTITVLQNGEPLAGAAVSLVPNDPALARWPSGSVTDDSGVAKLQTFGKYEGAPLGTYKVTVNKSVTTGDPVPVHPGPSATADQMKAYDRAMKTGSFEVFKVVASKFRLPNSTTISIDVQQGAENKFTADVEKAVKEKDASASSRGKGAGEYREMGS